MTARRLRHWQVSDVPTMLDAWTADRLRKALKLLGAPAPGVRKAELVERLSTFYEAESLPSLLDRLSEMERAALAQVVHDPMGEFDADRFRARHGRLPDRSSRHVNPLDLFLYDGRILPPDLRERLLALDRLQEPEPFVVETLSGPPETFLTRPPSWSREEPREIPVTIRRTDREAIRDLAAVLRLVDAGSVTVSAKKKRPPPSVQERIVAGLVGGDWYPEVSGSPGPIRGFAWPMLLQAGGLAAATAGRLRLTRAGRKALSDPPEETVCRLWNRWMTSTLLDELRRVEHIRGQEGKGKRSLTAIVARRAGVGGALSDCPHGDWVDVDGFFTYLAVGPHTVEVTRNPWTLYFEEQRYGSLGYQGQHDFSILEGRYALALLFEYAATLGLVDVAYVPPEDARPDFRGNWGTDEMPWLSRYDGLLAFRVNPLGALVLGHADAWIPEEEEPKDDLTVLPTLDVVVTSERPGPLVEATLDTFGERTGPNVWRLTRERLTAATSAGHLPQDLLAFLESRSIRDIPSTVASWIRDAERRTGALSIEGPAVVVRCRDSALAALVANDRKAGKLCRPCGDRRLVVATGDLAKFRRALADLGYPLPPGRGEEEG